MTVFFTSDLHFGHKNIVTFCDRPFTDVDEMNHALIERWNATVKHDDDIVWHMGDNAIEGSWKEGLEAIGQCRGRKRLITGNHDQCWPGKNTWMRYHPQYCEVFEAVLPWARTKVLGTKVNLSHFPYVGDNTPESRFDGYRLRLEQEAKPLIHGHTHSTDRLTSAEHITGCEHSNAVLHVHIRQVHVGVDAWSYRPVSDQEVAALLA